MSTHATKSDTAHRKTHKLQGRPPFECIALLLQGGGYGISGISSA